MSTRERDDATSPHVRREPSPLPRRGGGRRRGGAGLEGILAARRAPAFAQGTKLHILRWVDFIPACDVELKRQAPEAGKALGAEVPVRVRQRQRPAAAHHRRDPVRSAGPTSS